MSLLPPVVPDIPESRSGIVAARVARKIATLFGVPWDGAPFPLTWVCEYSALTISEIARGAPGPTRAVQAQAQVSPGDWVVLGRAIVAGRNGIARPEALPNEIAATTLNRFGPDTKAALVLTGANALLDPITTSIAQAWAVLEAHAPSGPTVSAARYGAWAGLVVDVYCAAPALLAAALQARSVQRASRSGWDLAPLGTPPARCEVTSVAELRSHEESSPYDLRVLDGTLDVVLATTDEAGRRHVRDSVADLLGARLRALGSPAGDGYLWLSERESGHRTVQAFVPYDPLITGFVSELIRLDVAAAYQRTEAASWIPPVESVTALPVLAKRCVVLALCMQLRLAFNSGDPEPRADLDMLDALADLDQLVAAVLPPSDPAVVVVRCRLADMRLEVLRQNTSQLGAIPAAVADLTHRAEAALRGAARGEVSAGDASEVVFSANVELLAVVRKHRAAPVDGLPSAEDQMLRIRLMWRRVLALLGFDPAMLCADPDPGAETAITPSLAFRLHNYATFLGRETKLADVGTGYRLFTRVVLPSRLNYYFRSDDFRPVLHTLQNLTTAGLRLARAAELAADHHTARQLTRECREHVVAALDASYTRRLLDRALFTDASDEATRFALLALPVLLCSLERGTSPDPGFDVARCEMLINAGERFIRHFEELGEVYTRLDELDEAKLRLQNCAIAVPS